MENKSGILKAEKLEKLKKQLQSKTQTDAALHPLSYGQKALWFLYQNAPDSSSYNVAFTCRIISRLDISALRRALQRLINRHPALRTTYVVKDGKPFQQVNVYQDVKFEVIDSSNLNEEELKSKVKESYNIPFNIEKGPVFIVHLYQISEDNFVILINMHHIANDGWSLGILLNDLKLFYSSEIEGKPIPLPPLNLTYIDYVKMQEEMLISSKGEKLWNYWKENLAGNMTSLNFPFDKQRPAISSNKGSMIYLEIENDLTSKLRELAKSKGVTLYMLLVSTFLVLLHKYSNQNDISIGTTTGGRNFAGVESLIGYFVNPVVVRAKFGEDENFQSYLNQVRKTVLGAIEHQDFPFPLLVEKLMPVREADVTPIFQVEFGLYKIPNIGPIKNIIGAGSYGKQVDWGKLKVEYYEMTQQEGQFDLMLELAESEDKISGYLKYSSDLFEEETIDRMSKRFKILLNSILKNPAEKVSKLKIITEEEEHKILEEWNNTKADYPKDKTIHQLFEQQSEKTPNNIAIVFGDRKLSYGELNKQSNSLAKYLRKNYNVQRNDLICVMLDKSEFMLITLLAILKSGGTYVPIDPSYPLERINYILDNCKSKLIITSTDFKDKINKEFKGSIIEINKIEDGLKDESPMEIENFNEPDDLAYIIYTSGTTGNPKGCMITHRNVVRLLFNNQQPFDFNANDVWIMAHSFCFDFSVWEMYGALLYGGKLIVPKKDEVRDVDSFLSLLKENKVTVLNQTPLAFYNLITEEKKSHHKTLDSHLRYVIFGGDKLEPQKLKDWSEIYSLGKVQLINMYGITETTVHVTFYRIKNEDINSNQSKSPIGKPIPETTVYVFDKNLNLVPVGVRGEFYVGGSGVSKGYLLKDELNSERFIANPYKPDEIIYKTGDEGFWLADGNLEYVGRTDNQVKVRGFRIELGEIENIILNFESVKEVIVLAREEKAGDKRLVAYLLSDKSSESNIELRQYLKEKLPDYMIPSSFIFLETFPMTANGKIDKKALAKMDMTRNEIHGQFVSPKTFKEKTLAKIWQEVIGIDKVGVHDNFFELGGDSIISIQIISRANQEGLRISPKKIFQCQTISELANVIEEDSTTASQEHVTGEAYLTPIQHWFFEQNLPELNHFNLSILLKVPKNLNEKYVEKSVNELIKHHDALRLKFEKKDLHWRQFNEGITNNVAFSVQDYSNVASDRNEIDAAMEKNISELQSSLNLSDGVLIRVRLFKTASNKEDRLLIIIHHLCVDGISWRIILEDFYKSYEQLSRGEEIKLPAKTNSFKEWSNSLNDYANSQQLLEEKNYWLSILNLKQKNIPTDFPIDKNINTVESVDTVTIELDEVTTQLLLKDAAKAYNTKINDLLLTSLITVYNNWCEENKLLISLEGHGREELFDEVDLSRTVGWFTSMFPVVLELNNTNDIGESIKSIKENLRQIPNNGIGFGLLKYFNDDESLKEKFRILPEPEIIFNYLGQVNENIASGSDWRLGNKSIMLSQNKKGLRKHLIEINSIIVENKLKMDFNFSKNIHKKETIETFSKMYEEALKNTIEHCMSSDAGGYTPSDFSAAGLNQQELDNLLANLN